MPKLTVRLALAGVAALSAVLLAGWTFHLHRENKRLGEAVVQAQEALRIEQDLRVAERAVATRYAKRVADLTTKQRTTDAKLQSGLRANPAWAAQPVPDSVADALGLRDED